MRTLLTQKGRTFRLVCIIPVSQLFSVALLIPNDKNTTKKKYYKEKKMTKKP